MLAKWCVLPGRIAEDARRLARAGDCHDKIAATVAVQNPDGDQPHALGHVDGGAADRAGDVGTVAFAVVGCSTVDDVDASSDPPA